MADKKISELPLIQTISGSTVVVPMVHDGTTIQIPIERLSLFTSQFSATTGSNTFIGNQIISGNLSVSGLSTLTGNTSIGGNLVVNGKLTAQELFTEITSASIIFESGSTIFGNSADDTHTITGTLILNGLAIGTAQLMAQTASQDGVNLRISSTTGSINTTTSSFNSVFLGISSVTGAINTTTSSFNNVFLGISSFTGSLNSLTGSYATTGSNTFRGNQIITGSLSISAGEFSVETGSGNMTSSLIFDHTQNDGVTLKLRHNDRLSVADSTFNVNVWAAGVYTSFVRNGSTYPILHIEAFDNTKIYLYRDTRLYNTSLVIDNNLTVQKDVVIGTGSLDINNGEFSITSGSGELTSSLSFTHTTFDPITGNATLALRYRNNDVGPENNAWRFVADDGGVKLSYDQYATSNKLLFSVSSLGSNFDKLLIWRDARLYGKGLTVDDSLLVKGVITGSLLATNGVVSSSNQLFELNQQTGSQGNLNAQIGIATASLNFTTGALNLFTGSIIGQNNTISTFTASVNFTTASLNTQTGSQQSLNTTLSIVTGSLIGITNGLMAFTAALDNTYATDAQLYQLYQATASIQFATASLNTQTGSQNSINFNISVVTSSIDAHILKQATQTGSQDLVNLGISSVTGSLIGITNGLMAFTAALDSTYATDAQLYQLYQSTASIQFATASLNTQTGSQNTINFNISVVTSSIDSHILKQATQTGSQDLVNLGISTFTGSLRSEVNLIEAYTASLKGAAIVSSSQQITNYYKFAETASANHFYGNQSIGGELKASILRTDSHAIVSDGSAAAVVLQGYINNALRIAESGSASSGGSRGMLYVGAIDVGGTTAFAENLVMASGKGIDFSANSSAAGMTSELLNDYEEGTWTIGMTFGGNSVGLTFAGNTGKYTKVGRQVTVNGFAALSNKGSSTGDVKITGLPFTIPNNDSNYSAPSLRFDGVSYTGQFQGYGVINTTTLNLEEITEAGSRGGIADTDFTNSSAVLFTFTYFV